MGSPYAYQSGSGGGTSTGSGTGKNYLGTVNNVNGNGDFELGSVVKWNLGLAGSSIVNGLPQGTPTFGSGTSNLTLTAINTSPLAGSWSARLASSAALTPGYCMYSDPFTIDREDQAKVMTGKIYYRAQVNPANGNWSGTSSNTFGIAIWDGSSWIYPAGAFGMTQSSGVGYVTFTFQTNLNSLTYSVWVYAANASAGAITVDFDDFSIGPQTAPFGPVMTDPVSWTPTGNWTNTTYTGRRWQIGNRLFATVTGTLTGTPGAANLTLNLPSGLSIDTTAIENAVQFKTPFGAVEIWDTSASQAYNAQVVYGSLTTVSLLYESSAIAGQAQVTTTAPMAWATGDTFTAFFSVPVVGWSSNVQMSNDTDTRVVSFVGTAGSGQVLTANATNVAVTASKDTHGAWTGSTYVVPVAGDYVFGGALAFTTAVAYSPLVFKNGVFVPQGYWTTTAVIATALGSGMVLVPGCAPGDILSLRSGGSGTVSNVNINVFRLSGPSVIAATESVNARYYSATATVTGTDSIVTWTTKDYDSHNAYSAGTYTIPVSGKYSIIASLGISGTYALNQGMNLSIYKNGSVVSTFTNQVGGAVSAAQGQIPDTIPCVAGDAITIRVSANATTPTVQASTFKNYFSISRAGN